MTLILVALLGRFHHCVLPTIAAKNIYPDPGSWLPSVAGRWAPAGFCCGGPGHSRQRLGLVKAGGWERGETSLSFPSVPATPGFGDPPQNETSTTQAALHPKSEPLELTPGRGTQIHHIFILNFARPPSLRCPGTHQQHRHSREQSCQHRGLRLFVG